MFHNRSTVCVMSYESRRVYLNVYSPNISFLKDYKIVSTKKKKEKHSWKPSAGCGPGYGRMRG